MTSIGLDGEKVDQVTFMEKPRIYLRNGDIAATARQTLDAFEAHYQILEDTGIRSSIGSILIVKITEAGNALIAGPSAVSGMQKTLYFMEKYSPYKILIDGAFFRHTLAKIAEATVYVVGANYSSDMSQVVDEARVASMKFNLKKPPSNVDFDHLGKRIAFYDSKDKYKIIDLNTAIGNTEKILAEEYRNFKFLYLPKSLSNRFVEQLISERHGGLPDIVVDSPVSLQLSQKNMDYLFKLNNHIYVKNPINLVAVCYNPYSPKGYVFDDQRFKESLESVLKRKVYNVEKEV